ncbi:MAG: transposase [Planctomycetaceae bacterium]|nr:transposase [Planctomycetaceae bacterium]MBV8310332.1 transposase [Planctomycetaceae bacterium]
MDTPTRDLLARMPLAEAVLTLWRFIADAATLDSIFERNRGKCYQKVLSFSFIVYFIRDALLEFNGSGRRSLQGARDRGELETSFRAAYGKLARSPIPASTALLAKCTARLRQLYPQAPEAQTPLPESLDDYRVEILDGKAIERVAERLKPLWGAPGGLLGGRALVAMDLRSGLATAMHAHPDVDASEARFVGALVAEVRRIAPGKRLWVSDSQFCDLTQPAHCAQGGDAFLIQYHPKVPFFADAARPARTGRNRRGQRFVEDWGWLGSPRNRKRLYVRRIRLHRPGEKDVILVTNLCDVEAVSVEDLLEVYLNRWGIERMFQQVVEVFGLSHLVGTTPEGTIFQFALCLLLYDLIQVVRGMVAVGAGRPRATISSKKLFEDVQRELIAWNVTIDPGATVAYFEGSGTAPRVKAWLSGLLSGVWKEHWMKSPPKKKQPPREKESKRTYGSVFRTLEAHQQKLKKEKRAQLVA